MYLRAFHYVPPFCCRGDIVKEIRNIHFNYYSEIYKIYHTMLTEFSRFYKILQACSMYLSCSPDYGWTKHHPGFRSLRICADLQDFYRSLRICADLQNFCRSLQICADSKKTDVLRNTIKTPQRCQTNNKNVQNWRKVSFKSKWWNIFL